MKIERMLSVPQKLPQVGWGACEVVPLFDAAGNVLAYAERWPVKWHDELPSEIFSHEMTKVNPSDAGQMSSFMSEYGMLGPGLDRRGRALVSVLDVATPEDACRIEKAYGLYSSHCGRCGLWRSPDEGMTSWYLAVRDALRGEGYAEMDRSGLNPYCIDYLLLVSAGEAESSFRRFRRSGLVCGAVAAFQETGEIMRYLNEFGCEGDAPVLGADREVLDEIRDSDAFLSARLERFSPKIGFVEVGDIDKGGRSYRHSLASYEDEFAVREQEEGCLELALATQIYNFALDGSKCRVCDYCHRVFVEKRSPTRKGAARSSKFCSDNCQNNKKQKRYRSRQQTGSHARSL